ncbi:hypothetical protein BM477_05520 [Boudabousia marimammalium]|uniref:AB hydrolase-1 domain-containing protein n=2 Tax=Boudabousia marimammalium TaxID=156892 RepID=A0A1Q5PMI7_9ACTO|nr:hypothetical protein BM477_05520 [Boudabousia marimammalium]
MATCALFLGACGLAGSQGEGKVVEATPTPSTVEVPAGLESYYSQSFKWESCPSEVPDGNKALCATFKAPKDYQNPQNGDLEVMAVRLGDEGASRPAILVNPGGPGGSAVDFVSENGDYMFTDKVMEKYDVVGMDSRGTKWSTPVTCLTDEEKDKQTASNSPDVSTKEGRLTARQELAELGAKCLEKDDVVKWVDTESAARDMDILRHLMGQNKLDYLGYSYGTFLGATYAKLFPQNTGRFVLDGVVDPSVSFEDLSKQQLAGFDDSIGNYVDWCNTYAKESCVLKEGEAGKRQLIDFLDGLRVRPLPTDDKDRELTEALAETAVFGAMYSTQWFDTLTNALQLAIRDANGNMLLRMADVLNERNADGTYGSNQTEAFLAINNLDYPLSDESQWSSAAKELKQISPLWKSFAWGDYTRADWPVKPVGKRGSYPGDTTPPMVLIGTTHDPATPLAMAQSLAKQMPKAVLVTQEGWDHTAYSSRASNCIKDAVDNFFIDGKLPENGLVCR